MKNKTKQCSCYHEAEEIIGWYTCVDPKTKIIPRCWGTKERDICSCGGDEGKCDFYPQKRAARATKTADDIINILRGSTRITSCNEYECIIRNAAIRIQHLTEELERVQAERDVALESIRAIKSVLGCDYNDTPVELHIIKR